VEKFAARYEQAFSTREFRRLARQLPLYMAIDDHEIDDNWSRDRLDEGRQAERLFFTAAASYAAYQYSHSPRNVAAPGFNYEFDAGGYPFLVLDTRTQRSHRGSGSPAILEDRQMTELERWLKDRKTRPGPKFIVTGSVLFPGLWRHHSPRPAGLPPHDELAADNWQMAQEQRRKVLAFLTTNEVRNVVFLSGDYHCSATATLKLGEKLKAYAVVSPPLYAPYVYANQQPHEVMRAESIAVNGQAVDVAALDALRGNGFADIEVLAQPGDTWLLRTTRYVLQLEDEHPGFTPVTRQLVLEG
jgi:phosphodiesterase/alkaline phosphatase D-like protein